jgi:hypothetical protein
MSHATGATLMNAQSFDANQAAPSESLGARIVNVLSADHRGLSNGIHAKHLAAKLDLDGDHGLRMLRAAISQLREDGIPIAGTPALGYFVATNAEELDTFCIKFLEGRALHSLMLSSRLRKLPLPMLMGQLLLNQS